MFITFEGIDGAGKSTVIRSIADWLRESGRDVLVTREPGGSIFGPKVREILLEGDAITPKAEVFLFLADRTQHVDGTIKPFLESGGVVLCDRYADSTLVYQGYGRGLDVEMLRQLNGIATGNLQPKVTFLLDLEPEVAVTRSTKGDRMDRESLEFFTRIRNGFLKEHDLDPERWVKVNADQAPDLVLNSVKETLSSLLF